jgi:hypothetical protein
VYFHGPTCAEFARQQVVSTFSWQKMQKMQWGLAAAGKRIGERDRVVRLSTAVYSCAHPPSK